MYTLDVRIRNMIIAVLAVLTLFLLIQSIASIVGIKDKSDQFPSTSITVRGEGEAVGTPTIATFNFTVREEAKDVAIAQQAMTEKSNKAIDYLKGQGVEPRDIKTESYYTSPKYDYNSQTSRQILTGFEVSQTLSVKVRDVEKAGTFLTAIAGLKVGEVSSLSFTIDDIDNVKAEAKEQAIEKARAEAEKIAAALGVKLKRVVGFYEEYPYDDGYGGELMESKSVFSQNSIAPNLQVGEQKVSAIISITYEIGN